MAIFKKRGKWWIGYSTPDGKRRREPVGESYALARDLLSKRCAEVAEAVHFPERVNNARPFKALAAKFMDLHGSALRSKSWASMLKRVLAAIGHMPAGTIKTSDIQHFYNRTEAETSTATANRHLTLVKSIFNKAIAWGEFHGTNPCNGVAKKNEPNHRLRYLSEGEIKELLPVCHPRLYPVVACALMTGMRKGEILKLDWRDVDFASGTIQVLETKSGKPRKIPLMSQLRDILMDIGPKPAGRVFELPEIMLRRFFAMALKAARIEEFRFHDLRHTFASHFAMKTRDLPALQQILGHASIQMTMRYAHLSDQHMAERMALLEQSFSVEKFAPDAAGRAPLRAPHVFEKTQNVLKLPIRHGQLAQR